MQRIDDLKTIIQSVKLPDQWRVDARPSSIFQRESEETIMGQPYETGSIMFFIFHDYPCPKHRKFVIAVPVPDSTNIDLNAIQFLVDHALLEKQAGIADGCPCRQGN